MRRNTPPAPSILDCFAGSSLLIAKIVMDNARRNGLGLNRHSQNGLYDALRNKPFAKHLAVADRKAKHPVPSPDRTTPRFRERRNKARARQRTVVDERIKAQQKARQVVAKLIESGQPSYRRRNREY